MANPPKEANDESQRRDERKASMLYAERQRTKRSQDNVRLQCWGHTTVTDQESRALVGMITDRDLCCSIVARGLDPKKTKIQEFITYRQSLAAMGKCGVAWPLALIAGGERA